MLTQAQKKQLKALANTLKIRYQLGKNEITPTVIDTFDKALTAHELIKVDVMRGVTEPIMSIALDLSAKLNADVVQVVGKVITLYRRNKNEPKIKLVK